MINSENAKSQYVTADVKTFAIGFEYGLDDLGNPEIAVTLAGTPLQFGTDYTLSLDKKSIVLVDGAGQGKTLIIERDIDFVQDSDYQLGRIDPEQIEDDFDLSVMRDQQIRQELVDYKNVTDSALEDISEQLVEHQDSIDTLTQNVSDLETNKADKSSVYTKGETDDKLALKADKANTYTKSDVDTRLATKADKETVYTKTETDSKLATKADASTVYTKTDVDGKLATKADKATTLAGYGITDAYTKEEVDEKIESSSSDEYVKKSGDTMTGTLNLMNESTASTPALTMDGYEMYVNGVVLTVAWTPTFGDRQGVFEFSPDNGIFVGNLQKYHGIADVTLGSDGNQWSNVYTEKLNNGADIAIPTTGGTMALLSDIPDTSNLATKAEVQQEIQDAIGTIETALAEV